MNRSNIDDVLDNDIILNIKKKSKNANYKQSLNYFIELNISIISYNDLLMAIDFSKLILFNKNYEYSQKIKSNNEVNKYIYTQLLDKKIIFLPLELIKNKVKIPKKKLDLYNYFKRTTKQFKNNLEVLFLCIKNLINKPSNDDTELESISYIHDISDNSINSVDDSPLYKDKILSINELNSLNEINLINKNGNFSEIKFFQLSKNLKLKIENIIGTKIDEVIVQKKYLPNNKFDIDLMFEKEVNCLKSLFGMKHFPFLLSYDFEQKIIILNYCGKPIKNNNIPTNWKIQADEIINSLEKNEIFHNDLWVNNLLVYKKILYVIDFGFGSFYKQDFPYINIDKNMTTNSHDLIELLDKAMTYSVEKRLDNYL